jgi:hypothetical protein
MLSVAWLHCIVDIALFHISNLTLYKAYGIFMLEWRKLYVGHWLIEVMRGM